MNIHEPVYYIMEKTDSLSEHILDRLRSLPYAEIYPVSSSAQANRSHVHISISNVRFPRGRLVRIGKDNLREIGIVIPAQFVGAWCHTGFSIPAIQERPFQAFDMAIDEMHHACRALLHKFLVSEHAKAMHRKNVGKIKDAVARRLQSREQQERAAVLSTVTSRYHPWANDDKYLPL
jgi:hypothetical protein